MTTTATKLATLNNLRKIADKAPLKAWKESTAKLDAAIEKLEAIYGKVPTNVTPLAADTTVKIAKADDVVKAKEVKAPKTKVTSQQKKVEGLVSIKEIAADLEMDAKVARAKLRRAYSDTNGGNSTDISQSDSRWMFDAAGVAHVKSILTGDKRKK